MTWLPVGVIYSIIPITGLFVVYYAFYNITDTVIKIKNYKKPQEA